jgi:hypothetical protein
MLKVSGELCLDELVAKLPELSWNQVFITVDALSRNGSIRLTRQGLTYHLALPSGSSDHPIPARMAG